MLFKDRKIWKPLSVNEFLFYEQMADMSEDLKKLRESPSFAELNFEQRQEYAIKEALLRYIPNYYGRYYVKTSLGKKFRKYLIIIALLSLIYSL